MDDETPDIVRISTGLIPWLASQEPVMLPECTVEEWERWIQSIFDDGESDGAA